MVPASGDRSRVDDTERGRGSALKMSAALPYMSSRAPRLQQAPHWPPEILPITPLSCPTVLVTEMNKCTGS